MFKPVPLRNRCAYFDCDVTNWDPQVKLFRFPSDDKRLVDWIVNSGNCNLLYLRKATLRHHGLCERHFGPKSFTNTDRTTLNWNARPIPHASRLKLPKSTFPHTFNLKNGTVSKNRKTSARGSDSPLEDITFPILKRHTLSIPRHCRVTKSEKLAQLQVTQSKSRANTSNEEHQANSSYLPTKKGSEGPKKLERKYEQLQEEYIVPECKDFILFQDDDNEFHKFSEKAPEAAPPQPSPITNTNTQQHTINFCRSVRKRNQPVKIETSEGHQQTLSSKRGLQNEIVEIGGKPLLEEYIVPEHDGFHISKADNFNESKAAHVNKSRKLNEFSKARQRDNSRMRLIPSRNLKVDADDNQTKRLEAKSGNHAATLKQPVKVEMIEEQHQAAFDLKNPLTTSRVLRGKEENGLGTQRLREETLVPKHEELVMSEGEDSSISVKIEGDQVNKVFDQTNRTARRIVLPSANGKTSEQRNPLKLLKRKSTDPIEIEDNSTQKPAKNRMSLEQRRAFFNSYDLLAANQVLRKGLEELRTENRLLRGNHLEPECTQLAPQSRDNSISDKLETSQGTEDSEQGIQVLKSIERPTSSPNCGQRNLQLFHGKEINETGIETRSQGEPVKTEIPEEQGFSCSYDILLANRNLRKEIKELRAENNRLRDGKIASRIEQVLMSEDEENSIPENMEVDQVDETSEKADQVLQGEEPSSDLGTSEQSASKFRLMDSSRVLTEAKQSNRIKVKDQRRIATVKKPAEVEQDEPEEQQQACFGSDPPATRRVLRKRVKKVDKSNDQWTGEGGSSGLGKVKADRNLSKLTSPAEPPTSHTCEPSEQPAFVPIRLSGRSEEGNSMARTKTNGEDHANTSQDVGETIPEHDIHKKDPMAGNDLRKQVDDLRAENERLQGEHEILQVICKEQEAMIESLRKEIQRREEDAARNVSLDEFLRCQEPPLSSSAEALVRRQFQGRSSHFLYEQGR